MMKKLSVLVVLMSTLSLKAMDANKKLAKKVSTILTLIQQRSEKKSHARFMVMHGDLDYLTPEQRLRLEVICKKAPDVLPTFEQLKKSISPQECMEIYFLITQALGKQTLLRQRVKFREEPKLPPEEQLQYNLMKYQIVGILMNPDSSDSQWLESITIKGYDPNYPLPDDIKKILTDRGILVNGTIPPEKLNAIKTYTGTKRYMRLVKQTSQEKLVEHVRSLSPEKRKKIEQSIQFALNTKQRLVEL